KDDEEPPSQTAPQATGAPRGPLPPRSQRKVETRPRFDPAKAAERARGLIDAYKGRLVSDRGALEEVFNRTGNLYDAQKRRAHAGELASITDYLDYGDPDGRTVDTLRVVPGRKGEKSADLDIKFTDGTETEVELTSVTSAPGIRKGAPAK